MDLDALKGKTIDDELLGQLKAHVTSLSEARDAARQESIKGRRGKDETITKLTERVEAMAERLGVDPDADLATLPDAKGQAEAARQFEQKLKRLERERDTAVQKHTELTQRLTTEKRNALLATSAGKHGFIDATVAQTLAGARVVQEGDDFLFRTDDGKLVPVDEGFAWMAKSMPFLVKPAGAGGSGGGAHGGGGFTGVPGSGGQPQRNPFHPKTFNLTEQIAMRRENPQLADQLKAAAQAAT